MRCGGDAGGRGVGAQHVGHVGHGDQGDPAVGQLGLVVGPVEFAGIGDPGDAQFDPGAVAQHLPRDHVGVVLHLGDEHRLAGLQQAAVAVGEQVDRLGAVLGEHDLVAGGRVHQARDGVAGALVGVGGPLAHPVQAAMHVGVLLAHRVGHRVDDGGRLHRGGGAVQEHQGFAMHGLRQDREFGADALHVERGGTDHGHAAEADWRCHQPSMACSSRAWAPSWLTDCNASSRKARIRMERASCSGMPRARR